MNIFGGLRRTILYVAFRSIERVLSSQSVGSSWSPFSGDCSEPYPFRHDQLYLDGTTRCASVKGACRTPASQHRPTAHGGDLAQPGQKPPASGSYPFFYFDHRYRTGTTQPTGNFGTNRILAPKVYLQIFLLTGRKTIFLRFLFSTGSI